MLLKEAVPFLRAKGLRKAGRLSGVQGVLHVWNTNRWLRNYIQLRRNIFILKGGKSKSIVGRRRERAPGEAEGWVALPRERGMETVGAWRGRWEESKRITHCSIGIIAWSFPRVSHLLLGQELVFAVLFHRQPAAVPSSADTQQSNWCAAGPSESRLKRKHTKRLNFQFTVHVETEVRNIYTKNHLPG